MHAGFVAEALNRGDKLVGEHGTEFLAKSFGAAYRVHRFHLRVPAFDAVFEIESEDADVDRFDDIFVELLEAFELADLDFETGVEACILQGDADVAGQRLEQLDIFAGKEVAADGTAQADDGDRTRRRAVLDAAGQIVVQIEQGSGTLLFRRQVERLLGVLEKDVRVIVCSAIEIEEAEGQFAFGRGREQAMRCSESQASRGLGKENGNTRNQQRAREPFDNGVEQSFKVGLGTEAAAKLDQGLAVVVFLAVERLVDPTLNPSLKRIEDRGGTDDGDDQAPFAN